MTQRSLQRTGLRRTASGNFLDGPLTAQLSVKNLQLAPTAREFGIATVASVDADALASATVHLSGTARHPEADIVFDATQATAFGERFERVRANLRYSAQSLAFTAGQADLGSGKVLFSGSYTHQDGDIHNGDLHVDVTAQAITASRVAELHRLEPGAEARLDGKAAVEIRIERGDLHLRSVSGEASARGVTLDKQKLGDVNLTAATNGNELALQAKAQVRGTTLDGQGKWSLEGDYPGSGTLAFLATQRGDVARPGDAARNRRPKSRGSLHSKASSKAAPP